MDLLSGQGDLIIVMEHADSMALLRWDGARFVLDAVAPGFTPQEVVALTEMEVAVAPSVRTME